MPARAKQSRPAAPAQSKLEAVKERYAVAVTDEVMSLIDPGDTQDPIALQYLPDARELDVMPQERIDPIGDDAHAPVKGIVHRYPDRVLLKAVHVCAVYCRFCFRREKVGPGSEMLSAEELNKALAYIRNTPEISEVILTGGDPFILSPRRLRGIMRALEEIPHVQLIRFHTRVPIADPARVTDELAVALESEKAVYVVLHVNHARELTENVKTAARKFIRAGIALLSQSVLLKGVNNDAAVLEELFRALAAMKVKPYYLHHPDLAPGTGHFRLSIEEGQGIMRSLRGRISGHALPAYVLDIPGGFGKVPVEPGWIRKNPEGGYTVTDYRGRTHQYDCALPGKE
ncbi:MAG: lysine-2,3-aminomutase-like protein [Alphaproteobacteria bacterium]|nr:lysine-2,3-aminomutase-like protein [Alphaproteobacteria bacterium]